MKPAPIRFSQHDLAVARICERHGWTIGQWATLVERDQLESLARDQYRQTIVESAMENMIKLKDGERTVADLGAYIRLFLETL